MLTFGHTLRHAGGYFDLTTGTGHRYLFDDVEVPNRMLSRVEQIQLLNQLRKVVFRVRSATATSDYAAERRRYIVLNKALNIGGVIAPRFRPAMPAGGPATSARTMTQDLISNDHQVLDLHWLATAVGRTSVSFTEPHWDGLFGFGSGLDVELASEFVQVTGPADNKCEILSLSEQEQLQLRVFQIGSMRKWWQRHAKKREEVRRSVVAASVTNPHLKGKDEKYANAWLATECAAYTGSSAVAWYKMISGEEIPATTLSHIKRALRDLLKTRSRRRGR